MLKYALKLRNLTNKEHRDNFTNIMIQFLVEVEKEYQAVLGYSEREGQFQEASPEVLKQMLNQASNRALEKVQFRFYAPYELVG